MLTDAEQRSTAVNNLSSVGFVTERCSGLGQLGNKEQLVLLIALKSWTNHHPHPLDLGPTGVLQRLAQGMVSHWVIRSYTMGVRFGLRL